MDSKSSYKNQEYIQARVYTLCKQECIHYTTKIIYNQECIHYTTKRIYNQESIEPRVHTSKSG